MRSPNTRYPLALVGRPAILLAAVLAIAVGVFPASAAPQFQPGSNEPGIIEPVTSALEGRVVRTPNTDQSVDGVEQSLIHGEVAILPATSTTSLTGHPIQSVTSPNDDMRLALQAMAEAAQVDDGAAMRAAADELQDILMGTTEGRIYDGFSMLNFNRWTDPRVGPEDFPADVEIGEYKMKRVRDSGDRFTSPFDGETRKVWEVDIAMLYYDGQIDSDTFLVRFPVDAHEDDTLRVNYRIYSLVQEDFSPTLVMLDKRKAANTVQFPFKGFDAVWVAFFPGEVVDVSVDYPPIRQVRGVYTWGWRVHPPRIQFLQPVYEIVNQHTNEVELGPQGRSFAYRNRVELTLDAISEAAPEMKMLHVAEAALGGATTTTISRWLTLPDEGPRGTWIDWHSLATVQTQLPPEAWDLLAEEGITPGNFGDFNMISAYVNNEMYGEGPFENEVTEWQQGDVFRVKLINLDRHTHYFRNVDFGTRLHDDILRCCGGGETSFEIMNFKPSYGAPKVAEMQWRAGWGFRPHYNVIQQQEVFARGSDRVRLTPYTGGFGDRYTGYQYSEEARGGDFRFNPPPFIISDEIAPYPLREPDGSDGLLIGQLTEGYGVGQICPDDPFPGFCATDIAAHNPNGVLNWPPPPLQGVNGLPDHPTELRFPPFLRNPSQGNERAGDIIPPTGAWRPFLWINPANGTLFIDPDDPSKGFWADRTYSHGAPVFAGESLTATIELPRASGQVFYQFDDLFHDNAIFSPHPLLEGSDAPDEITHFNAFHDLFWRVRGTVSRLHTGEQAAWVSLFLGEEENGRCGGQYLASSPVREQDGFFVFRCGRECNSPLIPSAADKIEVISRMSPLSVLQPGSTICVESVAGGVQEFTIPQ